MNNAANRGKLLMMASLACHGVRQSWEILGHCACARARVCVCVCLFVCVVGIAMYRLIKLYVPVLINWAASGHQAPFFSLQLKSVGQLETLSEACQSTQNKTIGKGTDLSLQLFCRFWIWCILYEMQTDADSSKSSPCMSWRCCYPVGATKQMWIDQRRGTKKSSRDSPDHLEPRYLIQL